jgi:hypothetical protein
MRNLVFAATGLALLGLGLPTITSAQAETVIIKRHSDRDWHRDWRADVGARHVVVERHDHGWHRGWDRDRN